MKKLLMTCTLLACMSLPANAGHHPAGLGPVTKFFGGGHVGGSKFVCWANPAGFLICAIVVAGTIRTVQEVAKGCTSDPVNWPARFWMPVCNWKGPYNPYLVARRRAISTRG